MEISVVVPTLNEEHYLPRLLESLEAQTFRDFEIIVSDAGSSDTTVALARSHRVLTVHGGIPSVGRNAGADAANGRFLFFLDADVIVPPTFLQKAVDEVHRRDVALATCRVVPLSPYVADHVIHLLMNFFVRLLAPMWPKAPGYAIFVAHWLFDEVDGFDETIRVCEDLDFVERAARVRALRYLASVRLWVSIRRYRYEGRLRYVLKSVAMNTYRLFTGELNGLRFRYDFGVFGRSV